MNKNIKARLFLMICVICALVIGVQSASASVVAYATDKCTNVQHDGIEYLAGFDVASADSDKWRSELTAYVETSDGDDAGTVKGLELQISGSSTRYQCTEITVDGEDFSCNSFPVDARITGVYFLYEPTVEENTDIVFYVKNEATGDIIITAPGTVD